METLHINIPSAPAESCPIFIGCGIFGEAAAGLPLDRYSSIAVITDGNVQPLWAEQLKGALPRPAVEIVIPAGERSKSIQTVTQVWRSLMAAGFDRHSLVCNLGGGMTGDIGGFAASTYMRGIDFMQVPTSLLAQVDASVGGKVGVNFAEVKNLVGTFQQPKAVIIDAATLETLPERELRAGFADVIKHAANRDRKHLEELAARDYAAAAPRELVPIIRRSCQIKADVVAAAEKEQGLRKILNFGHTVGHAVEMDSYVHGEPLLHGEAVALGMRIAAGLSARLGYLPDGEHDLLVEILERYGLPTRVPFPIEADDIMSKITSDKKNQGGSVKWTLLAGLGSAIFDIRIEENLLRETLAEIL